MSVKLVSKLTARSVANLVSNGTNRSFARTRPIAPPLKKPVQVQNPIELKGTAPVETSPASITQKVSVSDDILSKVTRVTVTVKTKYGVVEKGRGEGHGKITMRNGSVYTGEIVQNRQHGYGVITFASGASYEGMWEEGMKHGQGRLKSPNGIVLEGEFDYDVLLPRTARAVFD